MGWDGGIDGWEHVQLGGQSAHLDFTQLSDKTGTPSSPSSQSLRPPSSQETYHCQKLAAPVNACPDVMLVWWCSGGYCPKCALMVSLMATSTIPTGRRRHNLRPTNSAPPRSRLQGEFTRLHHVMLIAIYVSFSSNRQYFAFLPFQKISLSQF